jgi:hypothetical protein
MKKYWIFIMVLLGGAMNGQAAPTSPSSLTVKVFEMRVSKNSDCSGSVTVFKTASPMSVDLVGNPTLGAGAIPDGTYHCVMFHIDDLITVVPQATTGACIAGSPTPMDIYTSGTDVSVTPDGVKIPATPGEDDPWVYFSDSALASTVNNCFEPNFTGCACSGPCKLTTPLTISSDQTHSFVLDLDSRVDDVGGVCTVLLPPALLQSAMFIR